MSRFLAAFLAADEKARFSVGLVPNKSEKAKTPRTTPAEYQDTATEGGGGGVSPFSPYSGPDTPKTALSEGAPAPCPKAQPTVDHLPTAPAALLAYIRDVLHCRVTLEPDRVSIQPTFRCPPSVVAAALAVVGDLRRILEAEGGDSLDAILSAGGDGDAVSLDLPGGRVLPAEAAATVACEPTEAEVEALAAALADRAEATPGVGFVGGRETAMAYFRGQARNRLGATSDPMARGLMLGFERRRGGRDAGRERS